MNTYTVQTRERILSSAIKAVCTDRQQRYGHVEDNFRLVAKLWTDYFGEPFMPEDVGIMMALLKIARIKTGTANEDNYVDLAGYAACAGEVALRHSALQEAQEECD